MIVMSFRVLALLAALAVLAPALSGCATERAEASGTSVVTSFYPLTYIAERIAGDHVRVVDLTHPGQEPHDIELTVRQTAEVVDADVVLYEKGFQAAVDQAVEQDGPPHVVDAARSARLSGEDPHFWLDPTRLATVATAFERQIAEVDPAHAADYARHLHALVRDLRGLDRSFRTGLRNCRIRTIVVSHDAFAYLGRRYHLRVVGVNGLSPGDEPSPFHVREIQALIRREGITTVFSEQLASRAFARSIAGDLGIHAAVLDPIEGLSDQTADQDYLSLMRRNLATLRKANRCS
jgi:zinc transport system substrate-binding protein